MKTSEFIKYFKDKGYKVYKGDVIISVEDENRNDIFDISENNNINTYHIAFDNLSFSKQQEYYKVIFEYLMTPIEEREEEKKYKLQQKGVSKRLLIWLKELGEYTTGVYPYENENVKTDFTQEEIDEMPECYTHPAVWEQVEVGEEVK